MKNINSETQEFSAKNLTNLISDIIYSTFKPDININILRINLNNAIWDNIYVEIENNILLYDTYPHNNP